MNIKNDNSGYVNYILTGFSDISEIKDLLLYIKEEYPDITLANEIYDITDLKFVKTMTNKIKPMSNFTEIEQKQIREKYNTIKINELEIIFVEDIKIWILNDIGKLTWSVKEIDESFFNFEINKYITEFKIENYTKFINNK